MHAAPITTAATPAAPGTDANAPADGGDLFAGLMAALFTPAQAMPIAPPAGRAAPTDDAVTAGGKGAGHAPALGQAQGQPGAKTGTPLILPVLSGKGGVTNFAIDRMLIGETGQGAGDKPLILPPTGDAKGETVDPKLVLPAVPQPKAAVVAQTPDKPMSPSASASAQVAAPLPSPIAEQAMKPEVLAIRGQVKDEAPVPSPATLVAAQSQAAPLIAQPAAKPAAPVAEASTDRPSVGKLAKTDAASGGALQQVTLATRGEAASDDAPATGDEDHPHEGMSDDHAAQGPPAQANGAATADKVAFSQIAAVRGSPHTVAHLTAEIARRLEAQNTRFQVELEPAGLGRVDVKVDIGASGALSASLNFDSHHSAEALRARSGELQAALEQAGFDVTGGLSFTAGGMDHGQSDHGAGRHTASAPSTHTLASLDEAPIAAIPSRAPAGDGRLDIRI